MTEIKLVVFDLDGTLVSSHKTIYLATIKAFTDLGISDNLPEPEFYNMIGMHFQDIFDEFKIEINDFEEFIEIYKVHYLDLLHTSELYSGVESTLKSIREKNIKVALLTTKGQEQAEVIIRHFGLKKYFNEVHGRRPELAIKPNPEPLLFICKSLDVNPANTLMVGDSELDVNCAHNAKTISCAVTYGYRTREKLLLENPNSIIDSIDELLNILEIKGDL